VDAAAAIGSEKGPALGVRNLRELGQGLPEAVGREEEIAQSLERDDLVAADVRAEFSRLFADPLLGLWSSIPLHDVLASTRRSAEQAIRACANTPALHEALNSTDD
jgi:hypothetical protein